VSGVHDEWLSRAEDVATDLAKDALERDRAGAQPHAEVDKLRAAGLPALLVPSEEGGGGGDWATVLGVIRILAAADGSIAQILGYHYVNLAQLWFSGTAEQQKRWGRATAEGQLMWGDAVNPLDTDLVLRADAGGLRLFGTKSFATGSSVGDVIVVSAERESDGEPVLALVRADAAGIDFDTTWDNLGQRLSASGGVTFDGTPVDPADVLGSLRTDRVTPYASLVTPAIQAVFGHLYLGIAEGALHSARDYTRTTSRPWALSDVATAVADPYVLSTYGEMVARARAVAALGGEVASALDAACAAGDRLTWEERGEVAVLIAALKVVSTELGTEATNRIFEVTGARATNNRYGFDLFWRNVRTHTLHDPVAYKRREVGDHFLTGTYPDFTLYT